MKTRETSKQIYITVVTSGLTMLANKVARILLPNKNILDVCSELANEIAKENGLEWSNVLVNYYNHYSDETPQFDNWRIPSKPKSTKEQAIEWWNNLPTWGKSSKEYYVSLYYADDIITDERIEEIWRKECNSIEDEVFKSNQKQFKEFNPELFKSYISKFSDEDKVLALKVLYKSMPESNLKKYISEWFE